MEKPVAPLSGDAGALEPEALSLEDRAVIELIELLFFAYRDFIREPDDLLSQYNFGRAHHRVLHFIWRHPGMSVAGLLEILGITKQSLARVLKQLIKQQLVYQKTGKSDRRQRLLFLTGKGMVLTQSLVMLQIPRVRAMLGVIGDEGEAHTRKAFYHLIDADKRAWVRSIIEKQPRCEPGT